MPVVTAASTPEAPNALAGTNAAYPLTSEIVTLISGSGVRFRSSATIHPTARPIATPPAADAASETVAGPSENDPATTATTATRNDTSAVASLNRPSPSIELTSRRGTSRLRMMIPADSGPVGETIAPRTNAGAQAMPTTSWATSATTVIVTSTSPTELSVIARRYRRMSPRLAKKAEL